MTTMTLIVKLLVADYGNKSSDLLDEFVQPVSSHLLCLVSQLSRRTIKKSISPDEAKSHWNGRDFSLVY